LVWSLFKLGRLGLAERGAGDPFSSRRRSGLPYRGPFNAMNGKDIPLQTSSSRREAVWLEFVRQHVASVRFGVVQIVVHEGRVTQMEKTERVRLPSPPAEPPAH
jgi:hypothetical protein